MWVSISPQLLQNLRHKPLKGRRRYTTFKITLFCNCFENISHINIGHEEFSPYLCFIHWHVILVNEVLLDIYKITSYVLLIVLYCNDDSTMNSRQTQINRNRKPYLHNNHFLNNLIPHFLKFFQYLSRGSIQLISNFSLQIHW